MCLPTKNFQTCYLKHAYFLFGLSLSYISYLQEWIQENEVLSIVLKDNLHQPQYVEKLEKILRFMIKEKALSLQNLDKLWEAQVHIGVRAYCTVQICLLGGCVIFNSFLTCGDFFRLLITFANSLDPDQDRRFVGPDLDPNHLTH